MGPRRRRVLAGTLAAGLVAAAAPLGGAGASEVDPSPWPATTAADPELTTTAHSLRVAGADRFHTNLATTLVLRGTGAYPFGSADRTSSGAPVLADASGWWGAGACPFAVIVVASDSPADSLAATALSDPSDGSDEPYLQRSASADPAFDPVGGFDRVDTDSAPILITASARSGATGLSQSARTAAADLGSGGCTTAREAIVVGGTSAVPADVDEELVALGYDEVFRVVGTDRFDTAARVATALGTEPAPPGGTCADGSAAGGTSSAFYGNAVIELRASAAECRLLGRTVVLADGVTGADALAAGWWTSFWQVPVLLTGADGVLPAATRQALQTLTIENLVVLGGTARIPDATAQEAALLAGSAQVHRIAGADRSATSVEMARQLGGWYATGSGADYARSMVCLATSSGQGTTATGWPDALGAGPLCATLHASTHDPGAPRRALPPVDGPDSGAMTGGATPAHALTPILVTGTATTSLAPAVATLLVETFDPGSDWCSGHAARSGCVEPGFVVAFGGDRVLDPQALRQAATLVSGQEYTGFSDLAPSLGSGFFTELDMSPVFHQGGEVASRRACFVRGDLGEARWLAVYDDAARTEFDAALDVLAVGAYVRDADAVARSAGRSAPTCVRWADDGLAQSPEDQESQVFGVSLSGWPTAPVTFPYDTGRRLTMSGDATQAGPEASSGAASDTDGSGQLTSWTFTDSGLEGIAVTSKGQPASLTAAGLTLDLTRGLDPTAPDTFAGTLTLTTPNGTVTARVAGEAVLVAGTWRLRGATTFTGGTWNVIGGTGGFRLDLETGTTGTNTDDSVAWRVDGLVA